MFDLIKLFNSLESPRITENVNTRFATYPIPEYEKHRLGKDPQGKPAILIFTRHTSEFIKPAPIILEHLTVQFDLNCSISQPDGRLVEEVFTVLHCTGENSALYAHFLRVANALIISLGPSPSHSDVSRVVNRLVELFRSMKSLPKKSIQGLWAELFLIAHSKNSSFLINAWHTLLDDRYDFNAGNQRIEVKSVTGRIRQHYFSLEQLQPPINTQVLVASIFVERSGGGNSAIDLMDEIRPRISSDADALLHLDRIANLALGTNWRSASEEKFDRELAEQSLAFFETSSIPMVNPILPAGVCEVHFKADLTTSSPVNLIQYRKLSGLFRATFHR